MRNAITNGMRSQSLFQEEMHHNAHRDIEDYSQSNLY